MSTDTVISLYRPMLISIAYRMVGTMADAEDIVQDTLIKWINIDKESINNTKAYLITSVKNTCITHLNSIKARKESLIESWDNLSFQVIIDKYKEKEILNFDFENEMNEAYDALAKKLEPAERALFILRELFDVRYQELTEIFDKKIDNCRKIVSRAKSKLGSSEPISNDLGLKSRADNLNIINHIKLANKKGDLNSLITKLKEDL
jgi:RNA polymerase sigma-70 factor (ECF subfamily)